MLLVFCTLNPRESGVTTGSELSREVGRKGNQSSQCGCGRAELHLFVPSGPSVRKSAIFGLLITKDLLNYIFSETVCIKEEEFRYFMLRYLI